MRKLFAIAILNLSLIQTVQSQQTGQGGFEYKMVKGDTLWSLSKRYLHTPYKWPSITLQDGTAVPDVTRMSIGTVLRIPEHLANDTAQQQLTSIQVPPVETRDKRVDQSTEEHAQEQGGSKPETLKTSNTSIIRNPSLERMIGGNTPTETMRLLDYQLTQSTGLVRVFYQGQEVVVDVSVLIEEMQKARGRKQ